MLLRNMRGRGRKKEREGEGERVSLVHNGCIASVGRFKEEEIINIKSDLNILFVFYLASLFLL
jgi:hypothetical protein